LAAACLSESRSRGQRVHEKYASMLTGLISLHRGAFEHSEERLGPKSELGSRSERSRSYLLAGEYIGDVYLEQSDVVKAQEDYERVWPVVMAPSPRGDIAAELRRRMAEVKLLGGDYKLALAEAQAALVHCRELGDRYEEAATYRILALSCAALGKVAEA